MPLLSSWGGSSSALAFRPASGLGPSQCPHERRCRAGHHRLWLLATVATALLSGHDADRSGLQHAHDSRAPDQGAHARVKVDAAITAALARITAVDSPG